MMIGTTSNLRRRALLSLLLAPVLVAVVGFALPAGAWAAAPQWTVTAVSAPTNFAPGDVSGEDAYLVTVTNTGSAPSNGSTITVTDELPEGISLDPKGAVGHDQFLFLEGGSHLAASAMTCSLASCSYG